MRADLGPSDRLQSTVVVAVFAVRMMQMSAH
jgi:hypothetical protein